MSLVLWISDFIILGRENGDSHEVRSVCDRLFGGGLAGIPGTAVVELVVPAAGLQLRRILRFALVAAAERGGALIKAIPVRAPAPC